MSLLKKIPICILFLILSINCLSQFSRLKGQVKDFQSDENLSYVSIYWKNSRLGTVTDSNGWFNISINKIDNDDTLVISGIGYKTLLIPSTYFLTSEINSPILLKVLPPSSEVVVKSKYNRGRWFWKKIMKRKETHNRKYFQNFSYQLYNKLEVDIINFNKEKIKKNIITKPLSFILNFTDSLSEKKPFIPVYLTETISDYSYQSQPEKSKEVLKYTRTNGINNVSIIKELGGTYQNINIYNDFIYILSKQFISPFHKNADLYYNFKLEDTVYEYGRRFIRFRFSSKIKGLATFDGESWIHDTSFAVQKITLRPSDDANINFLEGLSIIQEYKLIYDTIWFLYKDKFIADVTPIGSGNLGMRARKTAYYNNVLVNNPATTLVLKNNKQDIEIDLLPNARQDSEYFWANNRPVPLEKSEQSVYKLIDTLYKNPTFKMYKSVIEVLVRGTYNYNKVVFGPWFNIISANSLEGLRLRFEIATNLKFDEHLYLNGYLAYGFLDNRIKESINIKYQISRKPWTYFSISYKNDIDFNRNLNSGFGVDNILGSFLRRPNLPYKFLNIEQLKTTFYSENYNGFSYNFNVASIDYKPLLNLPNKDYFPTFKDNPFKTFETSVGIRLSYQERFIERDFNRVASIKSEAPTMDFTFSKGWKDALGSTNEYEKYQASIQQKLRLSVLGELFYKFSGELINGNITYPFLSIVPGNEVYYYNKNAFNLLDQYEYLTNRNFNFFLEHNFNNSIFSFIKFTRKFKIRQFWNVRGIIGDISQENKITNFDISLPSPLNISLPSSPNLPSPPKIINPYGFKSLDGNWYMEIGTGFENIFRYFRIDFVWRLLSPSDINNLTNRKFGIYFSFKFSF